MPDRYTVGDAKAARTCADDPVIGEKTYEDNIDTDANVAIVVSNDQRSSALAICQGKS